MSEKRIGPAILFQVKSLLHLPSIREARSFLR
jgi:hypothetical protein